MTSSGIGGRGWGPSLACDITSIKKVKNLYHTFRFSAGTKQIAPSALDFLLLVGMLSCFAFIHWPNCSQQFLLQSNLTPVNIVQLLDGV